MNRIVLKAAKVLTKIIVINNTKFNISLDLTEIERKRQKILLSLQTLFFLNFCI